ncbi:MAG: nitrogenase iron-molybdenum cofactor biosynthesis protein NifE [Phycisphaeraceae bacterium]|nr:nitrogenase iron-molybdenum cofactor biosynthesis protein NifE [Phycisphaeraceae bacterium]
MISLLDQRKPQVHVTGAQPFAMACDKQSLAGSVSQRACVFCGSRVVLYPIVDAVHLVHGPIGCAAYTWDIRGALSSGPQLHRLSFSTDLQEKDVIYGGEKKLYQALVELIDEYQPKAAFVYSTCIVGLIGDDVQAICKRVAAEKNIPVLPVHSEGFKGTKKDGYRAACEAMFTLVGTADTLGIPRTSINILGDFNLAGETWILRRYYQEMGVDVVATITGDARIDDIRRAHGASLNVVQCSGSMTSLAQMMKEKYGIPFLKVSYFGLEDTAKALYDVAEYFPENPAILTRARTLVAREIAAALPALRHYRQALAGKRAALYTGGAFKAFSLVRALRTLGMTTVMAGSQTGNAQDYDHLRQICDDGTVLVDDTNPLELAKFIQEKQVDLFIGGVKERPIAFKLGVAFCDHNHERKIPLAGFEGMVHFAREVHDSVMSPVWQFTRRPAETIQPPALPGGTGIAALATEARP